MTNNKLGIAFLGCGAITHRHSKTLKRIKRIKNPPRLYYASRDPNRAKAILKAHDGAGMFASYEQAFVSDDVNAVMICTPPINHKELALAAIAAGKHVIVEKPPFLTVADMDEVIAAAVSAKVQLMVAENYFYRPLLHTLRSWIHAGHIGQPICFYVNALKSQHNSDWRNDAHIAGGGALFEGGIHWVSFMNNLDLGTPTVLGGLRGSQNAQNDRTAVLQFHYPAEVIGTLFYSWETPSKLFGLRLSKIYGTDGAITFETNGVAAFCWGRGTRKRLSFAEIGDISGRKSMFTDFLDAIRNNRPANFSMAKARQDLVVIESIYEQHEQRQAEGKRGIGRN